MDLDRNYRKAVVHQKQVASDAIEWYRNKLPVSSLDLCHEKK